MNRASTKGDETGSPRRHHTAGNECRDAVHRVSIPRGTSIPHRGLTLIARPESRAAKRQPDGHRPRLRTPRCGKRADAMRNTEFTLRQVLEYFAESTRVLAAGYADELRPARRRIGQGGATAASPKPAPQGPKARRNTPKTYLTLAQTLIKKQAKKPILFFYFLSF